MDSISKKMNGIEHDFTTSASTSPCSYLIKQQPANQIPNSTNNYTLDLDMK